MGDRLKQIKEKSKLRRQILAQQVRNTYKRNYETADVHCAVFKRKLCRDLLIKIKLILSLKLVNHTIGAVGFSQAERRRN